MKDCDFEVDCDTTQMHLHNEMEILYVLSGRVAVMKKNGNVLLKAEDFAVFNPFEYHELYKEDGSHTISLYIRMEVLKQCQIGMVECCSCIQTDRSDYISLIRTKMASIFKNYLEDSDSQYVYILSLLYGLLFVLKQQFTFAPSSKMMMEQNQRLVDALLYINQNMTENISLQDVAENCYLSKSHLSRLFHKGMNMTFSEYLREMRIRRAANFLCLTDASIMEIAVECGYTNCNTLIANFKDMYGMTPGEYRKKNRVTEIGAKKEFNEGKIFYARLLKHAVVEEINQKLAKRMAEPEIVQCNMKEKGIDNDFYYKDVINIGWAKDLLMENVRESIRKAMLNIGFEYVSIHGILDDAMDVYHEDERGHQWFSFTYIDIILDFVLSMNMKPQIMLGFTPLLLQEHPKKLFGTSCVQLPSDMDKWGTLLQAVLEHFVRIYGIEVVQDWRFEVMPALYYAYGVFTIEEYLPYYKYTYQMIHSQIPQAKVIGAMFDAELMKEENAGAFIRFIEYTRAHECMPEEFCFQGFGIDYSLCEKESTERRIISRVRNDYEEPAPPSRDKDILRHEIKYIRNILDQHGCKDKRIRFDAWNSTMWQRDLGNDTCYKTAFLVKNYVENQGTVAALSYCYLTDYTELKISNSNVYHGGYGLITYQGICKPAYGAYWMLNRLGSSIVQRGPGWIVTQSTDAKTIQILMYHYCHYDLDNHVSVPFSEKDQRTIDRYYEFQSLGVKNFRVYLEGIKEGIYDKESYTINRKQGSSYDRWMEMGAPDNISKEQKMVLEQSNFPGYKYEKVIVDDRGELFISAVLDEHEVRLITIKKK